MEVVLGFVGWLKVNYIELLSALGVILVGLEMLVRLTPTKKDDGAVARVAKLYGKLLDLLKVPNVKRKDGSYILPDGTHKKSE